MLSRLIRMHLEDSSAHKSLPDLNLQESRLAHLSLSELRGQHDLLALPLRVL